MLKDYGEITGPRKIEVSPLLADEEVLE